MCKAGQKDTRMSGSRPHDPIEDDGEETDVEVMAERAVATIVRLASNDEACKLLGIDGTLEDEVDIDFAVEPIDYVAQEIAQALAHAISPTDGDDAVPVRSLSALVALVRLYQTTKDGFIDEAGLLEAVIDRLEEDVEGGEEYE
mgnify:CR=1 FL=1